MINWPYAQLLINHFPVVLSVCALVIALLAVVVNRRGLWLTAMAALAIAGAFVYPVHFTGDKAGEALERAWYIRPGAIEAHDDAALVAMIVILIVGVFAAYGFWLSLKRPADAIPAWIRNCVLVGALAAVGTVTYTAYLGGKIIHESPVIELPSPPPGMTPSAATETVNP